MYYNTFGQVLMPLLWVIPLSFFTMFLKDGGKVGCGLIWAGYGLWVLFNVILWIQCLQSCFDKPLHTVFRRKFFRTKEEKEFDKLAEEKRIREEEEKKREKQEKINKEYEERQAFLKQNEKDREEFRRKYKEEHGYDITESVEYIIGKYR